MTGPACGRRPEKAAACTHLRLRSRCPTARTLPIVSFRSPEIDEIADDPCRSRSPMSVIFGLAVADRMSQWAVGVPVPSGRSGSRRCSKNPLGPSQSRSTRNLDHRQPKQSCDRGRRSDGSDSKAGKTVISRTVERTLNIGTILIDIPAFCSSLWL